MNEAFSVYDEVYNDLDRRAAADPKIVRVPKGANQKVADRARPRPI